MFTHGRTEAGRQDCRGLTPAAEGRLNSPDARSTKDRNPELASKTLASSTGEDELLQCTLLLSNYFLAHAHCSSSLRTAIRASLLLVIAAHG